jgi:translation initiation factor IF-3
VKITVMLRGREKAKPELAHAILDRVFADAEELGQRDGNIRTQPWAVSALLTPLKTGDKDAKIKNPQGSSKKVQNNRKQENNSQQSQ